MPKDPKTTFMRPFIIALFIFLVPFSSNAQSAPAAAMPDTENKILIDSLMKITKYKEYFQSYCDRQIDNAAKQNNWDEDVVRRKKLSVSFTDFKEYTIYNWFSSLKKGDLENLITLFQKLNTNKYSAFLVTHSGIQTNLELFVTRYLE